MSPVSAPITGGFPLVGHSVQISDGYVDNMMTLYRLRRPSGRPPDDI